MAVSFNHTGYDNFVLENQYTSLLDTQLDFNQFITVDNNLTMNPGMIVKINKYVGSKNNVEKLALGAGNTKSTTVSFTQSTYEVGCYQGQFAVYDETVMADPMVLDSGLRAQAEDFQNKVTSDVITEMAKATATISYAPASTVAGANGLDFNAIVDALAEYPYEDETGLYLVIGKAQQAELRKNLGEQLKYVEDFARSSYIGSVAGVPVYVSKAITNGVAYLGHPTAITFFNKSNAQVETKRDGDTRATQYITRKYGITALTDATKIVKIVPASE